MIGTFFFNNDYVFQVEANWANGGHGVVVQDGWARMERRGSVLPDQRNRHSPRNDSHKPRRSHQAKEDLLHRKQRIFSGENFWLLIVWYWFLRKRLHCCLNNYKLTFRLPTRPTQRTGVTSNLGEDRCRSGWVSETDRTKERTTTLTETSKTYPTKNVRQTHQIRDYLHPENRTSLRWSLTAFLPKVATTKCRRLPSQPNRRSIWREASRSEFQGTRWETFRKEDH